jgi:hypothetical protein
MREEKKEREGKKRGGGVLLGFARERGGMQGWGFPR